MKHPHCHPLARAKVRWILRRHHYVLVPELRLLNPHHTQRSCDDPIGKEPTSRSELPLHHPVVHHLFSQPRIIDEEQTVPRPLAKRGDHHRLRVRIRLPEVVLRQLIRTDLQVGPTEALRVAELSPHAMFGQATHVVPLEVHERSVVEIPELYEFAPVARRVNMPSPGRDLLPRIATVHTSR